MTTYAERLAPYANFKNKHEMDEQVTLHLQHVGYELNKTDRLLLNHMKVHATRYPGAFQQLNETIADAIGKSVATAKRSLKKLTELGIVKRKQTRKKNNSRPGASVYQFQFFINQNEQEKVSLSISNNDAVKPCESMVDENAIKHKPYYSFNKYLKDTNTTNAPTKLESLKIGLLNKLPQPIANAISPFMDSIDDIYNLVGTIFRAKSKADKTVQIEEHGQLYYKSIVSVFESQKRAAKKENDFNVFAVMYKAIMDVTKSIATGNAYEQPKASQAPAVVSKEPIPQFMIDNEKDPSRKAELQAMKQLQESQDLISRSKERVPDWMKKSPAAIQDAPPAVETEHDAEYFAMQRELVLQKLAGL